MTTGRSTLPTCSLPPLARNVFHSVAESDNMCCFAIQVESYRSLIVLLMKVYGNAGLLLFNQQRWDYEGCFDVLVVAHGNNSTKPIVILGDTLSIHGEYDVPGSALQARYRPHVALRWYLLLVPLLSCLVWPPWASSILCYGGGGGKRPIFNLYQQAEHLTLTLPSLNGGGAGVAEFALQLSLEAYR